jgi:hypothetical protein
MPPPCRHCSSFVQHSHRAAATHQQPALPTDTHYLLAACSSSHVSPCSSLGSALNRVTTTLLQPFCTPNTCRRLAGQSLQEAQRQAMHIGSAWATPSLHQATNRGVGPCPPQQPTNSTEPSSPNCWAASVLLSTNSNLSPWHTSPMPERGGQQGCNAYPSCHHDSHVTDVTSHPHHLNPMPSSGGWLSTLRFHPHLFSSFSGAALT